MIARTKLALWIPSAAFAFILFLLTIVAEPTNVPAYDDPGAEIDAPDHTLWHTPNCLTDSGWMFETQGVVSGTPGYYGLICEASGGEGIFEFEWLDPYVPYEPGNNVSGDGYYPTEFSSNSLYYPGYGYSSAHGEYAPYLGVRYYYDYSESSEVWQDDETACYIYASHLDRDMANIDVLNASNPGEEIPKTNTANCAQGACDAYNGSTVDVNSGPVVPWGTSLTGGTPIWIGSLGIPTTDNLASTTFHKGDCIVYYWGTQSPPSPHHIETITVDGESLTWGAAGGHFYHGTIQDYIDVHSSSTADLTEIRLFTKP